MASKLSAVPPCARPDQVEQVDYRRLTRAVSLAAIVAIMVNLVLYTVGRALGWLTDTVLIPTNNQPLSAAPVAIASLVGVLGATIVYALLGRLTRRPVRIFTIVAAIVLLFSFASPFNLPGAGVAYRALLLLMHSVVASASVGLLTTLARRE